jgi:hypothetical protein
MDSTCETSFDYVSKYVGEQGEPRNASRKVG